MKILFVNRNVIVSIFAVLLLIYGVQGISYAQEAPDTIVQFKNISLAKIVRWKLGLSTRGDLDSFLKIPKAELEKLTELNTDGLRTWDSDINDLTGLEHASQLTVLDLGFNDISDLTPLAQLTQLEHLTLWWNEIIDVTPLAQLTQLEHLNLSNNDISDVSPLLGLTSLKKLYLKWNPIEDISSLIAYHDANPDVDLDMVKYFIREEEGSIITATTEQPLTGATLDGAWVTLTLRSGVFRYFKSEIAEHLTIFGIPGIRYSVRHVSDDQRTIKVLLIFNGAITTDSILTLTVGPGAIPYYNGDALTVQIPVKGVTEAELTEASQAMAASTPYPLTVATLNGSVVTLKLTDGAAFKFNSNVNQYVSVSGIPGVTILRRIDPGRKVNDTETTVELRFSGSISEDTVLIFTIESVPIDGYNGPPRTAEIPVSATSEEPTGELVASTPFPLTKATLDDSFVTLTLQNDSYSFKADTRSGVGNIWYSRCTNCGDYRISIYYPPQ